MSIVTRDSAVQTNVDRSAQYRMRNVARTDFDAYDHLARSQRGLQVQCQVSRTRGWVTRRQERQHRAHPAENTGKAWTAADAYLVALRESTKP